MQYEYNDYGDVDINFNIDEQIEYERLEPFILLQPREIAISIAYQLFDTGYDIKQEYLDEEIDDYFKNLHEEIFEEASEILFNNGIEVE